MVALLIAAIALTALAQLFVIAVQADGDARRAAFASLLAVQKVEQLRSLGADLAAQGSPSLDANIPGACDFVDEYGRSIGTAATAPPGTVYIRRWSIEPIPGEPGSFVVQVAVLPRSWRGSGGPSHGDARWLGGAHIVTVKTKRAA